MMIEVVNRQRLRKLDVAKYRELAQQALRELRKNDGSATIAFISDGRMEELNRLFRGVNKTTDVLSFPAAPDEFEDKSVQYLGDIAISVGQAERQATANGLSFGREVAQLVLHGLLHLCGYDHETDDGEMNRMELRLRR